MAEEFEVESRLAVERITMAGNYLEQLVAEWYEYQGYFVRRNVPVDRRANGGYNCELDVVAFHPKRKHLIHLEPSTDAFSWEKRETRYRKKFDAGRKHIPELFAGLPIPDEIEQIALFIFGSTKNNKMIGGGRVLLVGELLGEIFSHLRSKKLARQAVTENFPILRTMQLIASNRTSVWKALEGGNDSQA